MEICENLYYTKEHEWASVNGNIVTIGITDYAQGELGDIVFVELPEVDSEFSAMDSFGVIEAVKTVSDLFAPVSGKTIDVNNALIDEPAIINNDPYGKGWMVKIGVTDRAELESMLEAAAYRDVTAN